jgi:signal recognition particle GTPase
VLDGTTGLNMLPQAREFNEVISLSHISPSNMACYSLFSLR